MCLTIDLQLEALHLKSKQVQRWKKTTELPSGIVANVDVGAKNGLSVLVTAFRMADNASPSSMALDVTTPDGAYVSNDAVPNAWILSIPTENEFWSPSPNPMTAPILIEKGGDLKIGVNKATETNSLIASGLACEPEVANRLVRSFGRFRVFQTATAPSTRSVIRFDKPTRLDNLSGAADSRDEFGSFAITIDRTGRPSYELYQQNATGFAPIPPRWAEEAKMQELFMPGDTVTIERGPGSGTLAVLMTGAEFI